MRVIQQLSKVEEDRAVTRTPNTMGKHSGPFLPGPHYVKAPGFRKSKGHRGLIPTCEEKMLWKFTK